LYETGNIDLVTLQSFMGHKKMEVTRHYIKDDLKRKKDVFVLASRQATSDARGDKIKRVAKEEVKKEDTMKKGKSKSKLIKRTRGNDYMTKEELDNQAALEVSAGK